MVAVPDDRGRHQTRMTTTMMITTMQQSNRMRAMRGGGNATAGDAMRGNATTSCSKQDANRTRRRTGEQEAIIVRDFARGAAVLAGGKEAKEDACHSRHS